MCRYEESSAHGSLLILTRDCNGKVSVIQMRVDLPHGIFWNMITCILSNKENSRGEYAV